jgi:hypothetical protein
MSQGTAVRAVDVLGRSGVARDHRTMWRVEREDRRVAQAPVVREGGDSKGMTGTDIRCLSARVRKS